jgi:prepilin peptidase CpaA
LPTLFETTTAMSTHTFQTRLLSTSAGVLAGFTLFATGGFGSWAGAMVVGLLMAVVEEDVRHQRIPNRLTFFGFAAALLHAAWIAGFGGLLSAFAGAGAALAVMALPFAMRWVGAGDVKAMMALAAFFGLDATPALLWWITVVGGAFAVLTLVARGGILEVAQRWAGSVLLTRLHSSPRYLVPVSGSTAATGMPFGVAIALGVAAFQNWGPTWI